MKSANLTSLKNFCVYGTSLSSLCLNVCHIYRVTVMGTQGQTSHKTLKMKGRQTCQSIRLVSSHQELLQVSICIILWPSWSLKSSQVSPNEITHPDTFSVQEIHLLLRPNATGVVTCMISAIGMWLIIGLKLIQYVNHHRSH